MVLSPLTRWTVAIAAAALLAPVPAFAQGWSQGAPAPLQQAQVESPTSGQVVARMSLRITQLENEIRRLTGQNEELAHKLRLLQAEFEKVKSDQELRLQALEGHGKQPNSAEGAAESEAPPAAPAQSAAPVAGAALGAKVLGTLHTPGNVATATPRPAPPKETPEQQYNRAHNLIIKHRDFLQAEKVLQAFIKEYPHNALAPNAHYWLGRTYYVREDYENAAFAFAEGFQKYPKSDKAPANLLNLGMSLARLGKNREACTTYARLLKNYASIDDSVKRRVARERVRAKCRQR